MKHREKIGSATLRSAAIAIAAFLAVPGAALAQTTAKIETVLTLTPEPNGRTENISEGPDGAIYITAALDRIVWKVKNGKAEKFFTSPGDEVISGVAGTKDELAISVATHWGNMLTPDGRGIQPKPNPQDPACRSIVLDKAGKVKLTVVSPDTKAFFNGLARAGDGWYLITTRTGVVSLDTKAKTLEPWFEDPMVRTNGIKVHNGWVYLTSDDKVYRVKIGPGRKPMGGAVVFATAARTDDFAIAPDGTLYIPSGKMMQKVTPSGQTSVFLDDIQTENVAAAWATEDGRWLYWPERFGPAKLMRIALK